MGVQPALHFVPAQFEVGAWRLMQFLLPPWLRWLRGIVATEVRQPEHLVQAYADFQAGKQRLIIAYRHPTTDDPPCMNYLLGQSLPRLAKQQGVTLRGPTHAHFLYDRGVLLWTGAGGRWLIPRVGGTPILRGKLDRPGLKAARHLLATGQFPLAIAPEGAVNWQADHLSALEPGLAQMAFWGLEDCPDQALAILPVGLSYRYVQAPWLAIAKQLQRLAQDLGLDAPPLPATAEALYPRLVAIGEALLAEMSEFYRGFYQLPVPTEGSLSERLPHILDLALQVAENSLHLKTQGDLTERRHRLEQAAWQWMYRDLEKPTPVQKALADRLADEASLHLWHVKIVENLIAVSGHYVRDKPTVERFAEMTMLVSGLVDYLLGREPRRLFFGERRVIFSMGEPIQVRQFEAEYKSSRRTAVTALTQTLAERLQAMLAID